MTTTTLQPWPTLHRPHAGHPVRSLQCLLRAHAHGIAVDGTFGPATEQAVRSFQASSHLTVDGYAGPQTWARIIITVRRGDKNDAVRGVQEDLARRDPTSPKLLFAIDGDFGPTTDWWVRAFQQSVGLSVDGVVGPRTWQAMASGMGAD